MSQIDEVSTGMAEMLLDQAHKSQEIRADQRKGENFWPAQTEATVDILSKLRKNLRGG